MFDGKDDKPVSKRVREKERKREREWKRESEREWNRVEESGREREE